MKTRLLAAIACPVAIAALVVLNGGSNAIAQTNSVNAKAVAAAAKVIAPYLKVPTTLGGLTQKLKSIPKGKAVDIILPTAPIDAQVEAGATAAASKLGVTLTIISAGTTPQGIQSAWSQALQSPPAAIIEGAIPPTYEEAELQQANAMDIPVITLFTDNSTLFTANIYGPEQTTLLGKLMGNFVIANSGGAAQVLDVTEPEFSGTTEAGAALESTLNSHCPGCTYLDNLQLQISGVGSTDPAAVVSYLQANPNTNWVVFQDASDAIGVPAALAQAGIHGIKILTSAGGTVNYAYIKAGQELADASTSGVYSGWALMDAAARAIAHQKVQVGFFPMQFITKKALTWNINNPWPATPGYQQKFEKLWGVK